MPKRPRPALPLLVFGLGLGTLGGCNDTTRYPSLAVRPIESMSLAEPAAKAAPAGTAPAAADARYAELVAQARDGDAAFRRTLDAARPALARGRTAAVGSDDWAAAQVGLSRLQAARTPVTQALLALQAAAEAPETRVDTGLAAAAERALATVAGIDQDESSALAQATPATS